MNKNRKTSDSATCKNSQNPFEEFGFHKQFIKTSDDITPGTSTTGETSSENEDVNVTPKLKKPIPSDIKRWASVVKAKKKSEIPTESSFDDKQDGGNEITQEILDCIFKTLLKSFENHRGFITTLDKQRFSCTVCVLELESVMSLSNHLKTRKHEDNVIKFLKDKLPSHLDHSMDFVSFYGYNLCCNLCRCKINMSSDNLFETIVNIIAHNSDIGHNSRKAEQERCNQASILLKTLTTATSEIKDNLHYIEKKMIPQFKCNLCNKNILYDENLDILNLNFIYHLRSVGHIKNKKAVETLKVFGEANTGGKDVFFVLNGNISCIYCNHQVEADLEKMITHVSSVEHAKHLFSKLEMTPSFSRSESLTSSEENKKNEEKSFAFGIHKKEESEMEEKEPKIFKHKRPDSRLNYLLNTLPLSLGKVDCLIENDKGSVTCLTCNKVVPPSTYNLRTHLLGSNHKKNEEPKKVSKSEEVRKEDLSHTLIQSTNNEEVRPTLKNQVFNCPSGHLHESNLLRNIPCRQVLEVHQCHQLPKKIPSAILHHLYAKLFKTNPLISQNKNGIVKSVDGKHSYCKVCKSLIPLSMDLSVLEENLVLHLKGKRHTVCLSEQNKSTPNTGTVVRSLFHFVKDSEISDSQGSDCVEFNCPLDSSCEDRNRKSIFGPALQNTSALEDIQIDEDSGCHETNSSLESENAGNTDPGQRKTLHDFLNPIQSNEDSQRSSASRLFVFGKEEKKDEARVENPKNCKESTKDGTCKVLPVTKSTSLLKFELETDVEVLNRRQKQIDYGKNTEGYNRYCLLVQQRKRHHPLTPPKYMKCSRRTWDGLVRAWRRQLHDWDSPSPSNVTSTLHSDIQPLPPKDIASA